jgi:molecular chaperone DnaK (HSP70)
LATKNNLLGELRITGLPPRMAGSVDVKLALDIDVNGILHATATHNVFF